MDQQKIQEQAIPLSFNQQNQSSLNLVCTINSKEPFTDPDAIQADFITNKGDSVLALKVIRTFVLIRLQGTRALQDSQFQDQPNQILSCFKLLDADHLIGGFCEGRVILRQISSQKILKDFNKQGNEYLIKKRPIKIHITQKHFITLFLEGMLAIYNIDYNQTKNDYDKFIRLSFQQHKALVNPKILKQFKPDNNFSYNFLHHGEFTNFQYILEQSNPHIILRFESLALNDAEILPLNPLEHLKKSEHVMENALILAFSGLDGYFRILEARKNKPLFSFKTEFAGICSFSFNPNFSSVCLGAQDDSAYIINFNQKVSWIRLIGHNSFISRGVFSSLSAQEFKIICGCYDGSISITDIDLNTLTTEDSMFIKAKDTETLNVKNVQSISQDGVANIAEYQNYVVCMNFDENYQKIGQIQQEKQKIQKNYLIFTYKIYNMVLENLNKTYKTRLGIYNFETKKRPQSAIDRIPTSKSKPVQLGQKASDFAKYPTKQKLSQVFVDDAAFGSSATKIEYIRELEQLTDALKKQNAEFQNIIKEKEVNQKPSQIAVPQKYEGHDKVGNSILIGKSTLQNVSTIRKQPYEKLKPDNTLQDRQIQNLMEEKKILEQEIQMYKETKRTRKAKLEGYDLDKLLKRKDKNSIIYETKQKFTQQQKQEEEIREKYLQALMQETFLLQQQLQKLQEESRHFDPHNVI